MASDDSIHMEVNVITGDLSLWNDSTSSSPLTIYNILDASRQDLLIGNPVDGNGTGSLNTGMAPYTNELFLSVPSDDPNAVTPIPGRSANNYSAWQILIDGYNSNGTALGLSEGAKGQRLDTINLPAFYSVDLGDIYNTQAPQFDLFWEWGTQSTSGTNFGTVYDSQPVDFVGLTTFSFWKNTAATSNWSGAGNWSAASATGLDSSGPPAGLTVATIANSDSSSHVVALDQSASIGGLVIGSTGGGIDTLSQTAADNLSIRTSEQVGVGGAGIHIQTNGTNTILGNLFVGSGSAGTYSLGGTGVVNVANSLGIGVGSTGTFNQSGGTLSVGSESIGSNDGMGVISQSGGVAKVAGEFNLLGGSYSLSGNASLTLSGSGYVGGSFYAATGPGSLNVADNAHMRVGGIIEVYPSSSLQIGSSSVLQSGSLSIGGTFSQNGGSLTVTGDINIGFAGAPGAMVVSGGSLTVFTGSIAVGGSGNPPSSSLTISGGTVNAYLNVYSGSTFTLSGGSCNSTNVYGNLITNASASPITAVGSFTLGSTANTLGQEIGSTHSFADVQVNGSLTLAGTLSLYADSANEALSNSSQTFILFDTTNGGVLSGSFSNISSGQMLTTTDGTASYLVTIVPGVDGFVELSNYAPVPEPTSAGVLLGGGYLILSRRRHVRRRGGESLASLRQ
jgi:hypothetical protein